MKNLKALSGWFAIGFISLTGGLILFWAILFSYWLYYPYEAMRADELVLDKYEAAHGEKVCFYIKGEKFMDLPAKVTIELVDGEAIHIMSYASYNPPGTKFKPRCFLIPPHAVPKDTYVVRWIASYPVNRIRDVEMQKDSAFIRVIRDKNMKGAKGDKGDKGAAGKDFWEK